MREENFVEKEEECLSFQIFTVSATLVGACLTVLGILTIFETLKRVQTIVDELVMIGVTLFSISCFLSYMAIRTKKKVRRYQLERVADIVFLSGIILVVGICLVLMIELA